MSMSRTSKEVRGLKSEGTAKPSGDLSSHLERGAWIEMLRFMQRF